MVETKEFSGYIEGVTKPKGKTYTQIIIDGRKFNTKNEELAKELMANSGKSVKITYSVSSFALPDGGTAEMKWIANAEIAEIEEKVEDTESFTETGSGLKSCRNESFESANEKMFNPEARRVPLVIDRERGYSFGMAFNGAVILTSQDHEVKDKISEMRAVEERFEALFKIAEEKRKRHLGS